MATITLTDRISVRVTAKDSTETSNQNKTNGGNVASALGGSGLTDSEKETLGETLGDTVTDESGKTYARSDKVATAAKWLKENNKIETRDPYYSYAGDDILGSFEYQTTRLSVASFGPSRNGEPVNNYYPATYVAKYGGKIELDQYSGDLPVYYAITRSGSNYSGQILALFVYPYDASLSFKSNSQQPSNGETYYEVLGTNILRGDFSHNNKKYRYAVYASGHNDMWNCPMTPYNPYVATSESSKVKRQAMIMVGAIGETTYHDSSNTIDPTGKTDQEVENEIKNKAAAQNCTMTMGNGDTYVAVTDGNGNPLYFLGT